VNGSALWYDARQVAEIKAYSVMGIDRPGELVR
jgi:hypothetical protein